MDMDLAYEFRVRPPAETLSIRIDTSDAEGLVLTARHLARRVELSDRALLKAFLAIPFLTLKVVGGIHWEALKIWVKGVALKPRPLAPKNPVSFIRSSRNSSKVKLHERA
jgi:DUF1365 family protein